VRWLVIDELAKPAVTDPPLKDLNDFVRGSIANFGVRANGTHVVSVDAGSNAAAFGLLPGDTIIRINGRNIPSGVPVIDLLSTYDAQQPMAIGVWRADKAVDLKGTYEPVARPRIVQLFEREKPSGRVDIVREGNTVRATTRGARAFTLLLSPDQVDFAKPVKVIANGRTVHEARVTASLATLTKWAAADNDRTMLFGAELHVTVPGVPER
jgi:membrane-associated protease RseP (regulator of RpoE activity)